MPWLFPAFLAVAFPTLLAFNVSPSPTFLNQASAFVGWGVWALLLAAAVGSGPRARWSGGQTALVGAVALLGMSAAAAPLWAALPWSLALSALGALAAVGLIVCLGAALARRGLAPQAFHAFCIALLVAGVLGSAIALVQVLAPEWCDGAWLAAASDSGRAAGNLRQPNHLSSLLLWSLVALVWLAERGRVGRGAAVALGLLMLAGTVLTASRTGAIGVLLLALWGWRDRRLPLAVRGALGAGPLLYAVLWEALSLWKRHAGEAFSGDEQLARSDFSSSRFAIWSNALSLIARVPWRGVGWGEFNFAWTMTPFPERPVAFFDHTHNLPLHFAVELGLPLALLVLGLMAWSLWRAFAAAHGTEGALRTTLRCAFMMVLMMALHSQLEYPLWYAYFLLPTAFAWGLCVGRPADAGRSAGAADAAQALQADAGGHAAQHEAAGSAVLPAPALLPPSRAATRPLWIGAALLVLGGAAALYDYTRVVAIFAPGEGAAPLAERIAAGQRSVLFGHHADYAAANRDDVPPAERLQALRRATHYLLDARLLQAWAETLDAVGDDRRARFAAARLAEFHNQQNDSFFAECGDGEADADAADTDAGATAGAASAAPTSPRASAMEAPAGVDDATAAAGLPFQCRASTEALDWRDFL